MKWFLFLVLAIGLRAKPFAQASNNTKELSGIEDSLVSLASEMVSSGLHGLERREACLKFVNSLVEALQIPGSFEYSFEKLSDSLISIQESPNKKFRIFTWEIYLAGGIYRHYGAIQMNNKKELVLYPLNDFSDYMGDPEDTITSNEYWYGAYYYNIISRRRWFRKYYFLFGWDQNSYETTKKVVEVLTFRGHKPQFGAPLFVYNEAKINKTRVIIEYKKESGVTFNYYNDIDISQSKWKNKKKMIIFDHLVSLAAFDNDKSNMVPDGSYEGFKWSFGKWVYQPKVFDWTIQKETNDKIKEQLMKDSHNKAGMPWAK